MNTLPQLGEALTKEHISFLEAFAKSCRHSIISMVKNSQSGHPGGSLSSIDYLATLYTFIAGQTGEKVIISNGHISPAVYSTLAEMGYIPKDDVIKDFRKLGSIYEGHVTRHVPGVWFGTGPLGVGISAACGFAIAEKLKKTQETVYGLLGDGEAQEGQVYEMMHLANKYKLDNFIAFIDYNHVQLTDSLDNILPINLKGHFTAAGWKVLEIDGHNYQEIWRALSEAKETKGKPTVILGNTIMGKGVDMMEPEGKAHKSTWHGNAPKPDDADKALKKLLLSDEETHLLEEFRKKHVKWTPDEPSFAKNLEPIIGFDTGTATRYEAGTIIDCRSAYGHALTELATLNTNIVALTADVRGSVKTDGVAKKFPERHIEVGIAEQNMMSCSGGLSLNGMIPFCSTFGAFLTSRAKDQARVNDINKTNVKMVATHCGLSVGKDGPTHQAIDDMGTFLGHLDTMIMEPADANQCDIMVRYIASHRGNFYLRMGRHKFPVITKDDGSCFYNEKYTYQYGKTDLIREGKDITIAASGACVGEALKAREKYKKKHKNASIEVIAVSSIKEFDETIRESLKKTKNLICVADHNTYNGLGSQLAKLIAEENININAFKELGVKHYQLSGTQEELYEAAGISASAIIKACDKILNT